LPCPAEANEELFSEGFDLAVISVAVEVQDKARILGMLPEGMPTLVLTSFVKPEELLGMVGQALP
jgi:hypothetical protein